MSKGTNRKISDQPFVKYRVKISFPEPTADVVVGSNSSRCKRCSNHTGKN